MLSPQRIDALLTKIRQQHPDLFDPTTGALLFPAAEQPGAPPPGEPPADRQEGDAAEAIRSAEAALAHQNSATAQLDLQVIAAILNAHLKTVDGKEALNSLQHDIESAVQTRTDLDTPAGTRDFQRFLIDKLKDIRAVVDEASLDDTSKSALMAAWTSLYNCSRDGPSEPVERRTQPDAGPATPPPSDDVEPVPAADTELDPYLDSSLAEDPDFPAAAVAGQPPAAMAPPAMPSLPTLGGIPSLGGAAMPGGAAIPGWSLPSGSGLPGPGQGAERHGSLEDVEDELPGFDDPAVDHPPSEDGDDTEKDDNESSASPESAPAGPTTVTLPNGESVTAASPQLAAAIQAAVGGMPIADAFRQQGITIPPPGTAVTGSIDPASLAPGDIGMFTDHHALALGESKTLLNGQIQHISTVTGPSFLGWEHPPAPVPAAEPAKTEPPVPTRPAATVSVVGTSE